VTEVAFELAALRAQRTRRVPMAARAAVERAAERLGQRLVDVRDADGSISYTLGWADGYEPIPSKDTFSVRALAPMALLAFGICIGICWRDRELDPYPGEAVPFNVVVEAAVRLGADYKHVVGALRGELQFAGLVVEAGPSLRLGPALAVWPPAQVALLRRAADSLPRGGDA
jgi:hypothetical protein